MGQKEWITGRQTTRTMGWQVDWLTTCNLSGTDYSSVDWYISMFSRNMFCKLITTVTRKAYHWMLILSQFHSLHILNSFFFEGGVGQTQAWMPAFMLTYYAFPRWYEFGKRWWNDILTGKTEELGEKPVPVPLCPPQIPHELTRARTRSSAVRGRRLTAWAIARPLCSLTVVCLVRLHFVFMCRHIWCLIL
jgi:hypothetical protein